MFFFKNKKERSNMRSRFLIEVEKDYNKPEYRANAMKIASSERGIESIEAEKNEENQNIRLIVIGKGVDSVKIVTNLRKKMGCPAKLVEQNVVMIEEVTQKPQAEESNEEQKIEAKKSQEIQPPQPGIHWSPNQPLQGGVQWWPGQPVEIYELHDPNPGGCTIL